MTSLNRSGSTLDLPLENDDLKKFNQLEIEFIIIRCKDLSDELYQFINGCVNVRSIEMKYHHKLDNLSSYSKLEKYLTKKISFEEGEILYTLLNINMTQYMMELPINYAPLFSLFCEYCECIPCRGHMIIYHKYPFEFHADDYPNYKDIFLVCDHDFNINLIKQCTKLKKEHSNILYDHCPDYMNHNMKRR